MIQQLFYTPFYEDTIELDSEEHKTIRNFILDEESKSDWRVPEEWLCEMNSSFVPNKKYHHHQIFKSLVKKIHTHVYKFIDNDDFVSEHLEMSELWLNTYRKGHSQERHDHGSCFLSGNYFFDIPKNTGDMIVYHPLSNKVIDGWAPYAGKVKSETGKLILFPSYLYHAVERNHTDNLRITISFNYQRINRS